LTGRNGGRVFQPSGVKLSIVFRKDDEFKPPVTKSLVEVVLLGDTETAAYALADIIFGDGIHSLTLKE
jgi:hypothetical protein